MCLMHSCVFSQPCQINVQLVGRIIKLIVFEMLSVVWTGLYYCWPITWQHDCSSAMTARAWSYTCIPVLGSVHMTHLIRPHTHLNSVRALWSDLLRHGCDQSDRSTSRCPPSTPFDTRRNWVGTVRFRSVHMNWSQMRWYKTNAPLGELMCRDQH